MSSHRKHGLDSWVRKIPWRRKRQCSPVCILIWKIPWKEEPGGSQSIGSQRIRHVWACICTQTPTQMRLCWEYITKIESRSPWIYKRMKRKNNRKEAKILGTEIINLELFNFLKWNRSDPWNKAWVQTWSRKTSTCFMRVRGKEREIQVSQKFSNLHVDKSRY